MTTPSGLFCVLANHCAQGEYVINGPFNSRGAAIGYAATLADDQLKQFHTDEPSTDWELDTEPDGSVVTISAELGTEIEWSVHELIAPT
jgi:hypothetical protein